MTLEVQGTQSQGSTPRMRAPRARAPLVFDKHGALMVSSRRRRSGPGNLSPNAVAGPNEQADMHDHGCDRKSMFGKREPFLVKTIELLNTKIIDSILICRTWDT